MASVDFVVMACVDFVVMACVVDIVCVFCGGGASSHSEQMNSLMLLPRSISPHIYNFVLHLSGGGPHTAA